MSANVQFNIYKNLTHNKYELVISDIKDNAIIKQQYLLIDNHHIQQLVRDLRHFKLLGQHYEPAIMSQTCDICTEIAANG